MFKVEAILNRFPSKIHTNQNGVKFPIYLALELKENFYIRIIYWQSQHEMKYGHEHELYSLELDEGEIKKNQKKHIVRHVMNRMKMTFSFNISDADDRFYFKKIKNYVELKKIVSQLYALLDQQIGLTDISEPKTFFDGNH